MPRPHVRLSGATHAELGAQRAAQLGNRLTAAYHAYARLFRAAGVDAARERAAAQSALRAIETWRPALLDELNATAAAHHLSLEQLAALNARTEILALASRGGHECSTAAGRVDGRILTAQTWDWHEELDPFWHTQEVHGPGLAFAGVTEHGIVGKIGVNSAGLTVHFNILASIDDSAEGLPVHVLARTLLEEARDVDAALELVAAAPIRSSSALTLADPSRAVSVELSPHGYRVISQRPLGKSETGAGPGVACESSRGTERESVRAEKVQQPSEALDGWVIRTNHYQDASLAKTEKPTYLEHSAARAELLRSRLAARPPRSQAELLTTFVTGDGEAPLCCRPSATAEFGDRLATLTTVLTDPAAKTVWIAEGNPADIVARGAAQPWRVCTLDRSSANDRKGSA